MKRLLAFVLAVAMVLSLTGCDGGKKKAFEASKSAYNEIDKAYEITEQFGSDIYEAWRIGIYEKDEILHDGVSYLASELNLTEDEIADGIAYLMITKIYEEDWDTTEESKKNEERENANHIFKLADDLFSMCVLIVNNVYEVNGKITEAQAALDAAKTQMKELSEKYSDYEHYPNLKGYYTTTSSFFDFCQNPTGSFEQVKTTINNYKNEARDYNSDLDYIFEE